MQNSNFFSYTSLQIDSQNKYILHDEASYNSLEKFLAFTNVYLSKIEKKIENNIYLKHKNYYL